MVKQIRRNRCGKFSCFRYSTQATQDMKEVQPIYRDGSWWEQWIPLGWRYGCEKHPPKPTKKFPLSDQERLDYVYGDGAFTTLHDSQLGEIE